MCLEIRRLAVSASILSNRMYDRDELTYSAVTNTDDFLIRMLKGCIQVGSRPDITNTINMVPVDHVARLVVAAAFHPPETLPRACQVTSHPRLTFNKYLSALEAYGYEAPLVEYSKWKSAIEQYMEESLSGGKEELALLGLYHMVTGDLPASTKSPELDDRNAAAALKADKERTGVDLSAGSAVTEDVVGVYLAYLVARGFMPKPTKQGKKSLPEAKLSKEQVEALEKVGGRGGAA